MLTFLAGIGTGLIVAVAVGAWSGARVSKRQRRVNALFGVYQRAVWDVQDHATFCLLCHPGSERVANDRTDLWRMKIKARDQALTAYLTAMGE